MSEKTVLLRCDECGVTRVGNKQVDDESGAEFFPACEKCGAAMYEQEPGKAPRPTMTEQRAKLAADEAAAANRDDQIAWLEKDIVAKRKQLRELLADRRATDQVKATADAFLVGTLPGEDRRNDSTGTA